MWSSFAEIETKNEQLNSQLYSIGAVFNQKLFILKTTRRKQGDELKIRQ